MKKVHSQFFFSFWAHEKLQSRAGRRTAFHFFLSLTKDSQPSISTSYSWQYWLLKKEGPIYDGFFFDEESQNQHRKFCVHDRRSFIRSLQKHLSFQRLEFVSCSFFFLIREKAMFQLPEKSTLRGSDGYLLSLQT